MLNRTMEDLNLEWEERSWPMRLTMIKRELDVSFDTIEELKNVIAENLLRIDDLKERVYFYQSVVAPEDLKEGLSIFDVSVSAPLEDDRYPIEIILRKSHKKDTLINGHVKVSVYGKDGRSQPVSSVSEDMKFSFRYFQRVRGILNVPTDFKPEKIMLSVAAGRNQSFERFYAWRDVMEPDILPSGS